MFFNRHLKQGDEIGEVALTMLKTATLGTSVNPNEVFNPPPDFFLDSYVVGFLTSYVGWAMDFGLGSANWSTTKKGECIVRAFAVIDPKLNLQKGLLKEIPLEETLHARGTNDGTSVMLMTFGKLRADDKDPKVIEAKELAEKMASSTPQQTAQEHLPNTAALVTIRQYIQEKWDKPHSFNKTYKDDEIVE